MSMNKDIEFILDNYDCSVFNEKAKSCRNVRSLNKDIEFILDGYVDEQPSYEQQEQESIDPEEIEIAADRLDGKIKMTPLIESEFFRAHLKLENLQITGAYNIRGALNTLLISVEKGDMRPVISASLNHGRGVAYAARQLGLPAILVVPTSQLKIDDCLALGVDIIHYGNSFDETCDKALKLSEENGYNFVHPLEDIDLLAGQGSIGVELLEAEPDVVVVPIDEGDLYTSLCAYLQPKGVKVVGSQVINVVDSIGTGSLSELPITI